MNSSSSRLVRVYSIDLDAENAGVALTVITVGKSMLPSAGCSRGGHSQFTNLHATKCT